MRDVEKVRVLEWDLEKVANSLAITQEEARLYFTDGRRVSFILERRICREIVGGKLAPSEGAGFDLIDDGGLKWEVRSITGGGIYFCPSYMVGSGRKFAEAGFIAKLEEIEGYIVSDVTLFPRIPVWRISGEKVLDWYERGELGAGSKISRAKALTLIKMETET